MGSAPSTRAPVPFAKRRSAWVSRLMQHFSAVDCDSPPSAPEVESPNDIALREITMAEIVAAWALDSSEALEKRDPAAANPLESSWAAENLLGDKGVVRDASVFVWLCSSARSAHSQMDS